jgi:hypothetical protein
MEANCFIDVVCRVMDHQQEEIDPEAIASCAIVLKRGTRCSTPSIDASMKDWSARADPAATIPTTSMMGTMTAIRMERRGRRGR